MHTALARTSRLLLALAALASTGCGELSVEPPTGGTLVAVTLTRSTVSPLELPRLTFGASGGALDIVWDTWGGCEIVSARAERIGSIVQVTLTRSPDPLALCAAIAVATSYQLHLTGLEPGTYSVRFFQESYGQPVREAGRTSITLGAAGS
jgi:hypothetical protein